MGLCIENYRNISIIVRIKIKICYIKSIPKMHVIYLNIPCEYNKIKESMTTRHPKSIFRKPKGPKNFRPKFYLTKRLTVSKTDLVVVLHC